MKIRDLTATALFAAVICVLAPLSIPIGPIPITMATFAVYLSAAVLGWKWGALAVLVYILLGMVGVPVFSNYGAGIAKLVGPTGGYIVGYLPCALITGLFADGADKLAPRELGRFKGRALRFLAYIAGMAAGTVALYALGTVWFCLKYETNPTFAQALSICVVPYLPLDAVKIAVASLLTVELRPILKRIGKKAEA